MAELPPEFLTPLRGDDVFATFGSGNKSHVVQQEWVDLNARGGYTVTARCGRRGKKLTVQGQRTPPNVEPRYTVCADCREFTRGAAV